MKKQLLIVRISIILIFVGLSGCTQTQTDDNTTGGGNNVEIISYSVFTYYDEHEEIGFYHNIPDNELNYASYGIKGVVKNNAGKMINLINITAHFYDANNSEIYSTADQQYTITNLSNNNTENFTISLPYLNTQNFLKFDHVNFEFTIS